MSYNMRKFVAPELITGLGSRNKVGQYAKNLGLTNVLVVTDHGVKEAGWAKDAIKELNETGVTTSLFMELTSNPKDYEIHNGVKIYNSNKCDGLIAVGGGSVIDCSKGIGIIANNSGNIIDYEGVDTIASPCPPIVCIPTTSGTSADVSQFAIISDTTRLLKMAIVSKALVPDVTLIDPMTTITMDSVLTANTGIDALIHSCEALVSNASSSITDVHALESIRLIRDNLFAACQDGDDLETRNNMTLGSLHAGLAFSNASLGAVHAISHAIGGLYDLTHGELNAILLPSVIEYNYPEAANQYDMICKLLAPDRKPSCKMLINVIAEFINALEIPMTLSELGVKEADFPTLADSSLLDACMATNPRNPNKDDVIEILLKSFK